MEINKSTNLLEISTFHYLEVVTYKAIVNDILVSATPLASEITPARILSLLSHYFSFLNILSLFKQRSCYSEFDM